MDSVDHGYQQTEGRFLSLTPCWIELLLPAVRAEAQMDLRPQSLHPASFLTIFSYEFPSTFSVFYPKLYTITPPSLNLLPSPSIFLFPLLSILNSLRSVET